MSIEPLPTDQNSAGDPRLTGVEIELGGLSEARVAEICAEVLGGEARQTDHAQWLVEGGNLGKLKVYLDTALRDAAQTRLRDLALDFGREVVPVEIVTDPLDRAGLERLEALVDRLRAAGAEGSGAGLVYGFGVHLNVQVKGETAEDIVPVLLAYALLEDWLRDAMPIDEARRVLPFTDPYPTRFVRALAEAGTGAALETIMDLYAEHTPSRNRGLDMLPLFKHLNAGRIAPALNGATSARPTYHFRLPDCRIDEAGWNIGTEWARWLAVERVSEDADLLERLRAGWLESHGAVTLDRTRWARRAGEILEDAGAEVLA